MSVTRGGTPIDLTPTEFQLLATLARQPGRVFTRAQLLDAVRGTRRRVVRARHRRARQEHPPQDRARSAQPALRADGLRRRLQVRRIMRSARTAAHALRPGGRPTSRGRRRRAVARAACAFLRADASRCSRSCCCLTAIGSAVMTAVAAGRWRRPRAIAASSRSPSGRHVRDRRVVARAPRRPARRRHRRRGAIAWPTAITPRASSERGPPLRARRRARVQHHGRAARSAGRQRRELMADIAHELRTPLSVIQGRLEGLLDGVYPRDDAQLAAGARGNARAGAAGRGSPDARQRRERDARRCRRSRRTCRC